VEEGTRTGEKGRTNHYSIGKPHRKDGKEEFTLQNSVLENEKKKRLLFPKIQLGKGGQKRGGEKKPLLFATDRGGQGCYCKYGKDQFWAQQGGKIDPGQFRKKFLSHFEGGKGGKNGRETPKKE